MGVVALVIAVLLFLLAVFTDGAFNLTQPELAYLGLAFFAGASLIGASPWATWPRRD